MLALNQFSLMRAQQIQQQEDVPLTAARVVGTKRIAPHRLVEDREQGSFKVRIPLLPYPILTQR